MPVYSTLYGALRARAGRPRLTIELYTDAEGRWRWRVLSTRNRKVLADSGQGYRRRIDALTALETLSEHLQHAERAPLYPYDTGADPGDER